MKKLGDFIYKVVVLAFLVFIAESQIYPVVHKEIAGYFFLGLFYIGGIGILLSMEK